MIMLIEIDFNTVENLINSFATDFAQYQKWKKIELHRIGDEFIIALKNFVTTQ